MKVGRTYHGCGSYLRGDGVQVCQVFTTELGTILQVFMVAGGGHGKRGPAMDSAEALMGLDSMTWTMMTPLPNPMKLPGMVTLGNKLYLAGDTENRVLSGDDIIVITAGADGDKCGDEIYTWDDKNNAWDIVGRRGIANKCVTAGTVAMTPELEGYC